MKKRRFEEGVVNHIYQRTVMGVNIFYELQDYLVYYTIFSIMAQRYRITVYGLCLMIDHIHSLVLTSSIHQLSAFMRSLTSVFVKEFNREYSRSGPLFSERFGNAPKKGMKLLRTAVSYLYNNPVERYLCRYSQEYRWNFLAYGLVSHPFSNPIDHRCSSRRLRNALMEVDGTVSRKNYLTYAQLRRLFANLNEGEKSQLADYIIKSYSVIRFDLLASCYDGYESMLTAINSNAGSEYEITEQRYGRSDKEYMDLIKYVHENGFPNAGDVIKLGMDSKFGLMHEMFIATRASNSQICKFLHFKCGT